MSAAGNTRVVKFAPLPPVSETFVMDFDHRVQALGGPVGTGKTIAVALKILFASAWIKPMEDGVRRSKFIIARRRYGDLEASIVKDFETVVAPGVFQLSGQRSPMYGTLQYTDAMGPVEAELYFYAFETEDDLGKIKSIKFTAGAIIEGQEFPSGRYAKKILERCNRFPSNSFDDYDPEGDDGDLEVNSAIEWTLPDGSVKQGTFLIMDINYPNRQHWMAAYFGKDNPVTSTGFPLRKLHRQPPTHIWVPGLERMPEGSKGVIARYRGVKGAFIRNPKARPYIIHYGWGYWENLILENQGDDALIQQNVLADFGTIVDGSPVHPKFNEDVHVNPSPVDYIPGVPVYVGADNDRNNAWIFGQLQPPYNDLFVIHEIVNVGNESKSIHDAIQEDVLPYVLNVLNPAGVNDVIFVLDQAFFSEEGGYSNKQSDILDNAGLNCYACPEKHSVPIRKTVDDWLGANRIHINQSCNWVIEALSGEYNFPVNRDGIPSNTPNKHSLHSHPAEAFGILVAGVNRPMARGNVGRRGARARKAKQFKYLD